MIDVAYAMGAGGQAGAGAQGGGMSAMLFPLALIAIFLFFCLSGPQQKKAQGTSCNA